MAKNKTTHSPCPDTTLLNRLTHVQTVFLLLVATVSTTILLAWILPSLAAVLPASWSLMKANTALGMLCAAVISYSLSHSQQTFSKKLYTSFYALLCTVTVLVLLNYASNHNIPYIHSFISHPDHKSITGYMSPQTLTFLTLFMLAHLFPHARKNVQALWTDFFTCCLGIWSLTIFSGYMFGALNLFGESMMIRTSPQTLFCMMLLSLSCIIHRAEYGYLSTFIEIGIGSSVARLSLPIVLTAPFVIVTIGTSLTNTGLLSLPYAAALTAVATSILLFISLLFMAKKINLLERDLREMALNDELTQVYNRRGFQLLGEQAVRDSQRNLSPLSVIFIDLDGLKTVNDTMGHDIGSQLIKNAATLLKNNFREADIIARVGGDEFAAVIHGNTSTAELCMQRLANATQAFNHAHKNTIPVQYSIGCVSVEHDQIESFNTLVHQADERMYAHKQQRKAQYA